MLFVSPLQERQREKLEEQRAREKIKAKLGEEGRLGDLRGDSVT